ncbi:MAG: hypothetical protein AAGG75_02755 [Bacteroidota bacterium]
MRQIILIIGLLCCALYGQAQPNVQASLDSAQILVGDQVKLRFKANFPAGTSITPPDLAPLDTFSKIEILDAGTWDTLQKGSEIICEQALTITSFDSGAYYIPSVAFNYIRQGNQGRIRTNRLLLEVSPPPQDSSFLAPIKPIIEESLKLEDFYPYLIGLLLVVLLVSIASYLYRRRKQVEAPPPPEVVIPAHEIALKKLSELKAAKLWQQGEVKEYQSQLTYIVREYIENRYSLQALESTTDEIIEQLKTLSISEEIKTQLREMLQMADLVKFAKATPPVDAHQRLMEAAENFVIKTQQRVVLNTEEEHA